MIEKFQYLDPIRDSGQYYGTLKKEKKEWVVHGEPYLIEMLKRLFPGTDSGTVGVATVPANPSNVANLNWLMMRYPLQIESVNEWIEDFGQACARAEKRELVNAGLRTENEPLNFRGKLYDFQKEGLAYLSVNQKCLLGDETGLGKTITALSLLAKQGSTPALVVAPSHVLDQWKEQSKKFLGVEPFVLSGLKSRPLPQHSVYLTHYLLLNAWKEELDQVGIETVIFDESQELRHNGTAKYDAALKLAYGKKNVVGMSGTPIYNYGGEIWNVMNVIEEFSLGTWKSFSREWCLNNSMVIRDPDVLGSYLKSQGLFIRRRTEDVMKDLPKTRRVTQTVDLNEALYLDLIGKSVSLAYKIPIMQVIKERSMAALDAVNNARVASGIAKAAHVTEFVRTLLDADMPILLFAYHHAVMDLYRENLAQYDPRFVTGRESTMEKKESVKDFMEGRTNLLILNLRTTAGLDLQRAKAVVFGELDWSPSVHRQAEGRCGGRIGVKHSVLAYYLWCPDTMDAFMMQALGLKARQFTGLMNDPVDTEAKLVEQREDASIMMEKVLAYLREQKGKNFQPEFHANG